MNDLKLNKNIISITSLEEVDEKAYWFKKTPLERLAALETMRQIIYGYDPSTTRLQRILTITQFSRS